MLLRLVEPGEYTGHVFAQACKALGVTQSMGRVGSALDNATSESWNSTLEFELLMQNDWHTREDARRAIFRYIEVWYNRKRRHSTLGYISPAAYEDELLAAA